MSFPRPSRQCTQASAALALAFGQDQRPPRLGQHLIREARWRTHREPGVLDCPVEQAAERHHLLGEVLLADGIVKQPSHR
ncbi:MAG: hypothetical protein IRY86_05500 [Thermorudis peleae]|nr:hypothetical protein [Thermorudis peleae]